DDIELPQCLGDGFISIDVFGHNGWNEILPVLRGLRKGKGVFRWVAGVFIVFLGFPMLAMKSLAFYLEQAGEDVRRLQAGWESINARSGAPAEVRQLQQLWTSINRRESRDADASTLLAIDEIDGPFVVSKRSYYFVSRRSYYRDSAVFATDIIKITPAPDDSE